MANNHPNTSGLISLADRPDNERTTIAKRGGSASGKKRAEIKRMSEIVMGLRQESEEDPIATSLKYLFCYLTNPVTSIPNTVKGLKFIKEICEEGQSNAQCDETDND